MKTSKILVTMLCIGVLGLASPSAIARGSGGWLTKMRTRVANLAPSIGQKVESLRFALKARLGGFRENQLVVGEGRVFHTADGGTQRKTTLWSVSGRRLLPEVVVVKDRNAAGRNVGESRYYSGNLRRIGTQLGRVIEGARSDPVFKAAAAGDAKARVAWDARFEAAQQKQRAMRDANPEPQPHAFVNRQGKSIVVKGLDVVAPFPVP